MKTDYLINKNDRDHLRLLAKKQLEYANLPVMAERKKLWYAHNALKSDRPVIAFDTNPFLQEMMPPYKCESETGRYFEKEFYRHITNHELIDDDKVVPDFFAVDHKFNNKMFGLDYHVTRTDADKTGRQLAYHVDKTIEDLDRDFKKLRPSVIGYDIEQTNKIKNAAQDAFGDILPVIVKNTNNTWLGLSSRIVTLMGLEDMMLYLIDNPEKMHKLYDFITDDLIRTIKWQENQGLLTLNNGNDYAGAGSRGFTDELPKSTDGIVRTGDLWGNLNSQETVSVSAAMYHEFCFPYYYRLAEIFGLVYYGCCEPVHAIWEDSVSKYPGLRKVSISPWCNEEYMGEALRDSIKKAVPGKYGVIYSRKPSPNYIGVGKVFDEEGFTIHITKTLKAAHGCTLEIISRDVVTLTDDIKKPGRATKIIRSLIEKYWQ